ncbi:MAG: hypothetical protein Fur0021_12380 [Candidatus Promineifilaceae bacterium]
MGLVYLRDGTTLGMLATVLLSLAGTILGVVALVKKDLRRGMAIAGIIINLLCLLPYLMLFIFVLLPK